MKLVAICLLTLPVWAQSQKPDELDAMRPEPPMLGVHWAKGEAHGGPAGRGSSPNLVYHLGPILPSTATQAIFWGKSWSDATFVGDKITGLDTWYSGVGKSFYAMTSDEYAGSNGTVTAGISYSGHLIDTSSAPSKAPSTSTILGEVCKEVTSPKSDGTGYYAVYVDTKRGNAGYCAWHSSGSCGGIPVQFAFFFNLDGDAGCDPQDAKTGNSQGLAALANVTGHELSEARTDPLGNGWYDKSGEENADKCAWTFGSDYVSFSGSVWKIQGNWSNAAYNNQAGYGSQKGCIDGGNYR